FNYVATIEAQHDFTVHAIVLSEKYERFPDEDKERLENLQSNLFSITDIKIKSPNNPANLLEAKLLTYAR
ncbi:MAG: NgoPII family restriction endonuclease, partial [Methylococcaceae bacterium]